MPKQVEFTFVPAISLNPGWEPRPLQLAPPRWTPPGPWCPDDPEAFMRGWMRFEEEVGIRPR